MSGSHFQVGRGPNPVLLAARWQDEARPEPEYHYEYRRYVDFPNFPFKPGHASTPATPLKSENLLVADKSMADQVAERVEVSLEDRALALCWIFHLTGDAHQPLPAASLFDRTYPNGNRGGTTRSASTGPHPPAAERHIGDPRPARTLQGQTGGNKGPDSKQNASEVAKAGCGRPQSRCPVPAQSRCIFDKTRTPLRVWLAAAWYLTNQKQGVSALGLQRLLGLGNYQTAWTMLHRFRRAMVRPDRERLKGSVEVDETYLAITDREEPVSPVGRKSRTSKVLVVLAVEMLQPKGFGRIRLRRIDNDCDACVVPFLQACRSPMLRFASDKVSTEIAKSFGVDRNTVSKWRGRYAGDRIAV